MIAQMAERVVVMYAGRIVEQGTTVEVLRQPQHPYTRGLIASRPVPSARAGGLLHSRSGAGSRATACGLRVADRCEQATARCRQDTPPLLGLASGSLFYSQFAESVA